MLRFQYWLRGMNFKRNLKSTSFYLFLGICLFFIGYAALSRQTVETINQDFTSPPATPLAVTYSKVTRVIDGDTVVIETGEHVRYIGINTPEVETSECYASEASEINKNLVLGKIVKLEKDVSDTDKYGRLLRFVYIGDIFVDDYLIKNGSAKVMTIPPDIRYRDEFLESEEYAKQNRLGLWSNCF